MVTTCLDERRFGIATLLSLVAIGSACRSQSSPPREEPPPAVMDETKTAEDEPKAAEVETPRAAVAPASRPDNPVDLFTDKAAAYLASVQSEDGSWPYFQSEAPDFAEAEASADLLGTISVLMNLKHTDLEASPMFERGVNYLGSRRDERFTWALDVGEALPGDLRIEPDADRTSSALTLLAGRFTIEPDQLEGLRSLFERHKTPGLYATYFDGFHRDKGFVPHPNVPSLGVNLNVLGFFGAYGLERATLAEALGRMVRRPHYGEEDPFYRSLPRLAYLASNAIEHGAPEAEEMLRRFVGDFGATTGREAAFAEKLASAELAAYVKARSHLCLLERSPCRDLDMAVFELSKRRNQEGSWPIAPFHEHDANPAAFRAFVESRDFTLARDEGGLGYDVDRALASPGAVHYYGGSPAETTSFALKALVLYRKLLAERPAFGPP